MGCRPCVTRLIGLGCRPCVTRLIGLTRLAVVRLLVGVGCRPCVTRLIGLTRLAELTRLAVVGLLVGLTRLVRLAEEGLVGIVALSGSRVGAELGLLLLLPLAHGNRDASTDSGRWDCSHQQPRPGGSGAAPSCALLRAARRRAGSGFVLPLDLVRVPIVEGDLGAVNLAAVGFGDLAGEGHRLSDVEGGAGGLIVEVGGCDGELVPAVRDAAR